MGMGWVQMCYKISALVTLKCFQWRYRGVVVLSTPLVIKQNVRAHGPLVMYFSVWQAL